MNLRHPFGQYLRIAESQPVNDRPQRSFGMKWCLICAADRPSLGSKKIGEGLWSCALHRRPESDVSGLALRLVEGK